MYASSIFSLGKAAIAGSETEQRLTVLLHDDSVQVISTLELHQLATFTFQEQQVITCSTTNIRDAILEQLEKIQKQPAQHSTLTVQKSLVLTRHLLLFGSDHTIPVITQQLGHHILALREYNTVLIAQQQGSMWLRLKGGAVDEGGPVREMATKIVGLLQHPSTLLVQERNRVADPTSLVPVGERTQVGWGSEKLRYQQLQAQLKREQALQTRSNLAKADNGFGSGYNAANGQTVVGAAHGIEEMLAQQRKLEQKFRDDKAEAAASSSFNEYQAPDLLQQQQQYNPAAPMALAPPPAPEVDLLDFGSVVAPQASSDLLGGLAQPAAAPSTLFSPPTVHDPFAPQTSLPPAEDPFGFAAPPPTTVANPLTSNNVADSTPSLLGDPMPTTATNPLSIPTKNVADSSLSLLGGTTQTSGLDSLGPTLLGDALSSKPQVMGGAGMGSSDPFASLNGLGSSTTLADSAPKSSFAGLGSLPTAPSSMMNMSTGMGGSLTMTSSAAPSVMMQQGSHAMNGLGDNVILPHKTISLSSIQVSAMHAPDTSDSSPNEFLMGGGTGAGLEPVGPAPGHAPPPPPPAGGFY